MIKDEFRHLLKVMTPENVECLQQMDEYIQQHGFLYVCIDKHRKFPFPAVHVRSSELGLLCRIYNDYEAYLGSLDWKQRANRAKARDLYRCVLCNKGKGDGVVLHTHHCTYERTGNELLSDLYTLCEPHHRMYELQMILQALESRYTAFFKAHA